MQNPLDHIAIDVATACASDHAARLLLEQTRWPNGVICPHCRSWRKSYRIYPLDEKKVLIREGLFACGMCRKQFTVTVGTIMEDTHIPLRKWIMALFLLCSSGKPVSVRQLHKAIGVTYKTAWHLAKKVRTAMATPECPLDNISETKHLCCLQGVDKK